VLLAFENLKAKNKCQWSVILKAIHAALVLRVFGSVPESDVVFYVVTLKTYIYMSV